MRRKRIIITGGSGYIGRHLIQYFKTIHTVLAPTHSQLDLSDADAVGRYLKKYRADVVIHAAVVGGSRMEEARANSVEANLRMFFNIVRNRKYFKKLIHFGSGAEYDKSRPLKCVKESAAGQSIPRDGYGLYKYIVGHYIETSDFPAVNLRIFGLFGPGEDYRLRFISYCIVSHLLHRPIVIGRDCVFDYVYIMDFVRIVEHFVSHDAKFRTYNVGSGTRVKLTALARLINKKFGNPVGIRIKHAGLNNEYTADGHRLKRELKGFHFTDFETSLSQLYDWYAERLDSLSLPTS